MVKSCLDEQLLCVNFNIGDNFVRHICHTFHTSWTSDRANVIYRDHDVLTFLNLNAFRDCEI